MFNHLNVSPAINDFKQLINILYQGLVEYRGARSNKSSIPKIYEFAGWTTFFKGDKGTTRCDRMLVLVEEFNERPISDYNESDKKYILLLTLALFETSSTWLTSAIAHRLIQGKYMVTSGLPYNVTFHDMRSEIIKFNPAQYLMIKKEHDAGRTEHFHMVYSTHSLLWDIAITLIPNDDEFQFFKGQVNKIRQWIDGKINSRPDITPCIELADITSIHRASRERVSA